MTKITKEELLHIAQMSRLAVEEKDIESICKQMSDVLDYAERVQEIAKEVEVPSHKNINADREDTIIPSDQQAILSRAPEQDSGYFVVPKIIDN